MTLGTSKPTIEILQGGFSLLYIANIDSTYTATHVDTRTANFWKGDEVKTTAYSVTDDFYKYYGLSKSNIYPATANKKSKDVTLTIDGVTYSGTVTEK